MGKVILRLVLLIGGLAGIAYGGLTVYKKQFFPINHSSFTSNNEITLFIPSVEELFSKENGIELAQVYMGDEWEWFFEILKGYQKSKISLQISLNDLKNTISVKGCSHSFYTDEIVPLLAEKGKVIAVSGKSYYIWKNSDYIVISTSEINVKHVKKTATLYKGNADFFVKGADGVVESVKLTNTLKYSAYVNNEKILKGKAVQASEMLSICPIKTDLVKFYGSTRYRDDATSLQNNEVIEHSDWVKNSILYIQRDSFEVIAGIQNDGILLKSIILETNEKLRGDSAVQSSIYFNNIEIIPFQTNWNWKSICVDAQTEMRYFANYDDFVFLTNNLQAMYWLLKNIQLGKTYDGYQLNKKIPAYVNNLVFQTNESGLAISTRTWISPQKSINLSALSNKIDRSNSQTLLAEFDHVDQVKHIFYIADQILIFSDNIVVSMDARGKIQWQFELNRNLSSPPLVIKNSSIAVVQGNKLIFLNLKGQQNKSETIAFDNPIESTQLIGSGEELLLAVQSENQIHFYSTSGAKQPFEFKQTSSIQTYATAKINSDLYLAVHTKNDSSFLFNVHKNELIASTSRSGIAGKLLSQPVFNVSNSSSPKMVFYEKGILKVKDFKSGLLDSIALQTTAKADNAFWIELNNKPLILLENYDRITLFNTLGLSEGEIAKPEPNSSYLPLPHSKVGVFAFVNNETKKCYFTDEYGNLLLKSAVDYEGLVFLQERILITKSKNSIQLYKID